MGIQRGSISTPIIADGLIFNMDAANRASYVPYATQSFDTTDLSISGSFISDPTYTTSPPVWNFDGVDDYIEIADDSSLVIPDILTVSIWSKSSTANEGIIYKGQDITQNGDWAIADNGGSYPRIFLNGGTKITGTTNINDGNWHHLAFTYNSGLASDNVVLYVNGVSEGSADFTTSLADNGAINIGRYYNNSYTFTGQIANAHIYNRALSANEVLHNYNALKGRFV